MQVFFFITLLTLTALLIKLGNISKFVLIF